MVLILLAFIVFIVGCSTNKSESFLDPSEPVELTLWHYYNSETQITLESLIKEFNGTEGLEKGIIINSVAKGSIKDLENELENSAKGIVTADNMPDIFSVYDDKLLVLDKLGVICDLNPYFNEEEKEKYVDDFLKYDFETNRLLSVPIAKCTEVFYANKRAIETFSNETGQDYKDIATWEEYYNLSREYYKWSDSKTPDVSWDGQSFMGIDSIANYVIMGSKQLGVDIIDGDAKEIILNKKVLKQIFDIYYKGISLGYFNSVGMFRSDDVKAGEIVAFTGSTSSVTYFPTEMATEDSIEKIDLFVNNYPYFEGGEPYAILQGAGMSVSKSTPQREEAASLFLKWLTEPKQNFKLTRATGYLPVQKDSYSEEFTKKILTENYESQKKRNIETVYLASKNQLFDSKYYINKAFEKSYDVRGVLGDSLESEGEKGKEKAELLKNQGLTEEEILQIIDTENAFIEWIGILEEDLKNLDIKYRIE